MQLFALVPPSVPCGAPASGRVRDWEDVRPNSHRAVAVTDTTLTCDSCGRLNRPPRLLQSALLLPAYVPPATRMLRPATTAASRKRAAGRVRVPRRTRSSKRWPATMQSWSPRPRSGRVVQDQHVAVLMTTGLTAIPAITETEYLTALRHCPGRRGSSRFDQCPHGIVGESSQSLESPWQGHPGP